MCIIHQIYDVKNKSVVWLFFLIFQKVKYTITSGYANETRKIYKVEHKKFTRDVAEICYIHMKIPQTIPTSLQLSDPTIDISYVFQVCND